MADFTSVQSGNWADGATWGNASPGTAGVDYPGADGDTATVAATHVVNYDLGDSTINFGSVTLNGKLSFPATANSTINFADLAVLTINNGGELEVGTETVPIDGAYHTYFYWAQGAAVRYVLVLNDGGKITVYGDPAYYSSTKKLTLASAWDASAGDTLYVTGDQSATWPVGARFYLNKGYTAGTYAGTTDYQTDADIFEIASVGAYDSVNDNTPITVVAGHGSLLNFLEGQELCIISRNVVFGDPGAPWEVYGYNVYAEHIQFDNNQSSANRLISFNSCTFAGWDRAMDRGYNYYGQDVEYVACGRVSYGGINSIINGDVISCYRGIDNDTGGEYIGEFKGCYQAVNSVTNCVIHGSCISNNWAVYGAKNISGELYCISNNTVFDSVITGSISGSFISNNSVAKNVYSLLLSGNFVDNGTDTSLVNAGTLRYVVFEDSEVYGVTLPLRVYKNSGSYLPLQSTDTDWVAPPSGSSWILQCLPNSYCNEMPAGKLPLSPLGDMAAWATTADTSIGFNIYPVGWTTALTEAEISITARYYDAATGNSRTTVTTVTATFSNGVWSLCSASITPAQDGIVYYQLTVKAYESGAHILVDPEVQVS